MGCFKSRGHLRESEEKLLLCRSTSDTVGLSRQPGSKTPALDFTKPGGFSSALTGYKRKHALLYSAKAANLEGGFYLLLHQLNDEGPLARRS